ncbi:MAG: hydrogenase iron-sulfur subunit [Synergistaceae bacterium]|jgi:Pyruvate/2-oxoacid:ferredoxin oxidoreductase delta subunit/coenzyme F420-reducing hydrogenase delta subunit|nr:hydrogenase iron-sulfur subunit [Synergistaceae bacterium]
MNLLIAGKSDINRAAREFFESRGVGVKTAEDISGITKFEGEVGDFRAAAGGEEIEAAFVLLTELPACEPEPIDGGAVEGLFARSPEEMTSRSREYPDVFLLDYFRESPAHAAIRALGAAGALAAKKRRAYYLSRFARTADYESETLYSETRNAGAVFVKYDELKITRAGGVFKIAASDGALEYEISTDHIYSDGARDVGGRFRAAARVFGLRAGKGGFLVEDRHFLEPVRTSRRGVYHIGRDAALRAGETFAFILRDAKRDAAGFRDGRARAEIDGNKCVLCRTCERACPHAAMTPDTAARAMKNMVSACEGCGICVSLCPCSAIALAGERDYESPGRACGHRTLIMCCENGANEAIGEALSFMGALAADVDIRAVPCGGRISAGELGRALENYGGVMAAVCPDGACAHFDGNKRACLQAGQMADALKLAGLSGMDVATVQVSHAMPRALADAVVDFMTRHGRSEPDLETAS